MRTTMLLSVVAITAFSMAAHGEAPPSVAHLANADEVRQRLGVLPEYRDLSGLRTLKVAVLDYGFDGMASGRPYLPRNTVVVERYDADLVRRFKLGDPDYHKDFAPGNPHGRVMAQIIWAMTGFDSRGPQFYLLNANGPTMLRRAVRYAIEAHVDIILFSGVFEGGGNGDGWGPINHIVEPALDAGIVWINAAGNYGHCVYDGPVRVGPDGYLRFRDDVNATALRFRNRLDENTVTVTLSWNDYREQEDAGTIRDLDLYVEDWNGQRLAASELKQITKSKAAGPGTTRNPRERVILKDLPAAPDHDYRIRIRDRSGNFTARDRIRVLITAAHESYLDPRTGEPQAAVRFIDATGKSEIYPPADNPRVLTVGDLSPDSSIGPTADYRLKPELVIPDSRAFFSDGTVTSGSSNAAAYFAGVVTVLKAAEPGLRTRHLLRLAYQDRTRIRAAVSPPSVATQFRPVRPAQPSVSAYRAGTRQVVVSQRVAYANGTATSARERLPMPAPVPATALARDANRGKVWQTPTRQELAALVAAG